MREVLIRLQNMIRRCYVDQPGQKPQLSSTATADRLAPDVEVFEPQGLHFVAPASAQGVLLAPNGQTSVAVALGLGGVKPTDGDPGEGGLHYLGAWKLFLAADGTIALGDKVPGDFVALASKVDSENQARQMEIQGIVTAIMGGVPVPMDGGAGLQASIVLGLAGIPAPTNPTGSTKVRAK